MKQVAIAIDQLINTVFGGYADETLSARVYRNRDNSWWWAMWVYIIDSLFFWQNAHCLVSYNSEMTRKQLPKKYRK